jgi:hypothetical protein
VRLDLAIAAVEQAAGRLWPPTRVRSFDEATAVVHEAGFPATGELGAVEAGEVLRVVHEVLVGRAEDVAQALSPYAWLWYLRRLPVEVFAGAWSTTEPYDLMLAETLSASSRQPELLAAERPGYVTFDLGDEALAAVFRLCGYASAISAVQVAIRRAGKGQVFRLDQSGWPRAVDDGIVQTAIELYDLRVQDDHGGLVAGTESVTRLNESSETLPLLCAQRLPDWQDVPGWQGPLLRRRLVRVRGRWFFHMLTIDRLLQMLRNGGGDSRDWWEQGLPSLVLLLRAVCLDAIHNSEVSGSNLPRVGYVILPEARLRSVLDACLTGDYSDDLREVFGDALPDSGETALAAATAVDVCAFPLAAGPLVRQVGGMVLVDLGAATQRLLRMVTVPGRAGGALANVRAMHYEGVVQNLIDGTVWRPEGADRSLIRRVLRRAGRTVTDIDAVAARDGTLLLVSCKSLPYSEELDAGEYKAVRNARTLVEQARHRWDEVVTDLIAHPHGDNYDLSGFNRLVGVVVTPHIVYTADPTTLDELFRDMPGLRKVSSVGELGRWLGGEPPAA